MSTMPAVVTRAEGVLCQSGRRPRVSISLYQGAEQLLRDDPASLPPIVRDYGLVRPRVAGFRLLPVGQARFDGYHTESNRAVERQNTTDLARPNSQGLHLVDRHPTSGKVCPRQKSDLPIAQREKMFGA